jgi:hypothetical protein
MAEAPALSFKHFVDEVNLVPADLPQFFSKFVEILVGETRVGSLYNIDNYMVELGPREETASIFESKGNFYPKYFKTYRLEVVQEGDKVRLYFWSSQPITLAPYATALMKRALHATYTHYVSKS